MKERLYFAQLSHYGQITYWYFNAKSAGIPMWLLNSGVVVVVVVVVVVAVDL